MGNHLRFEGLLFALLCLIFVLPPAAVQAKQSPPLFNGVVLQDGDIFLTRAQSILSSLYAHHGTIPGNYSHAAIFFHEKQKQPVVMHVQFSPCTVELRQFAQGYRQIALLRANLTQQQRSRLAETLRTWTADPVIRRARFDHTMQDIPGRREQFYCIGLINEIWRSSELPPPFVNHQKPARTKIMAVMESDLGFDLTRIISANAILYNPDFSLLTEWHNPKHSEESKFILDQVSFSIAAYVEEGYCGLQPGFLSGLIRRSAAFLKGYSSEADRSMYLLALTRTYYRKIRSRYQVLQRRGQAPEPGSEDAALLIKTLCDHYRDDYFTRICQVSPAGAVYPVDAADR